eukprot:gnl/TRDRNA2_/TRDRNA2_154081_c0_seq2.p1 gnl/TRDRNA2_/TRDRNA2_154081_c0~~gnl/TRDRNA2_/TRDRNA2_154081_c0_seq2.p1  ORF type:complete len:437 (-),score=110.17 gnl/TRDRNA2_/TRDRNA2_154081_c0_seq2:195-1505(-)
MTTAVKFHDSPPTSPDAKKGFASNKSGKVQFRSQGTAKGGLATSAEEIVEAEEDAVLEPEDVVAVVAAEEEEDEQQAVARPSRQVWPVLFGAGERSNTPSVDAVSPDSGTAPPSTPSSPITTRPRTVRGARAHINAVSSMMERPVGRGSPRGAGGAVVQLVRISERCEEPPAHLILACLEHVKAFAAGDPGAEQMLSWTIEPVLKVIRDVLADYNDELQALCAEVRGMQTRSAQYASDITAAEEELVRREARERRRYESLLASKKELDVVIRRLRGDIAGVQQEADILQGQVDGVLRDMQEGWDRERRELEDSIAAMTAEHAEIAQQLDLDERRAQAKEKLSAATAKLKALKPGLLKQEDLRRRLIDREGQITELTQQLMDIQATKKEAQKKAKHKTKAKKGKHRASMDPGAADAALGEEGHDASDAPDAAAEEQP